MLADIIFCDLTLLLDYPSELVNIFLFLRNTYQQSPINSNVQRNCTSSTVRADT